MSHLLVLCEDELGEYVLENFLSEYRKRRFKSIDILSYRSNTRLRTNFAADVTQQLTDEPDSSVLCLVDLYKEPFGVYQPEKMTFSEGFENVQKFMYAQVDTRFHSRFGAFPVVMEIETWLLADPNIQTEFSQSIPSPETIKHPAELLANIYEAQKKSKYGKIIDGKRLFAKASAKRIYDDNCDHFKLMIDWLVQPPPDKTRQRISEALIAWEQDRERRYQECLMLDEAVTSDDEESLNRAIAAWDSYNAFLQTRDDLFKD